MIRDLMGDADLHFSALLFTQPSCRAADLELSRGLATTVGNLNAALGGRRRRDIVRALHFRHVLNQSVQMPNCPSLPWVQRSACSPRLIRQTWPA